VEYAFRHRREQRGRQQPLFLFANTLNANTDPSDFDLMGRYYWSRDREALIERCF
jgi:hypothetical protein